MKNKTVQNGMENKEMNIQQELLLIALLMCSSKKEASEFSGMSRGVIKKYLADPNFKRELDRRRHELVRVLTNRYTGGTSRLREKKCKAKSQESHTLPRGVHKVAR